MGSSRAHHHYDTPYLSKQLSLEVYNAGFDGNGVILSYGFLSLILQRYTPKLILFDVEPSFDIYEYANDNGHKRYISILKPYYRNESISLIIKDISKEEWVKVHSGLLRYNSCFISILRDNVRGISDSRMGFDPLYGEFRGGLLSGSGNNKIDSVKLQYMRRLITLSKEKKIPLVLIASPKYTNVGDTIYSPITEICTKESVLFWDFQNDTLFMQHPELFKEPMHLNEKGAKLFSDIIAHRIKRNSIIQD